MNGERWLADDLVDPDVYANGVDEGWTDIELYRLVVRQLQRSFHSGTEADRQTMLNNRPHLTNTKWDAAMARGNRARSAHARLRRTRLGGRTRAVPPGTREADRVRDRQRPRLAASGAFLRRGVSIDSRDLDGRTGDGRQWTAEL